MESRTAEVPFSADWEAVKWVVSRPKELFQSLPFEAEISGEEPLDVRIRLKKRLFSFEFRGKMDVAFADSTATYIMKGTKGLLILSASVGDGRLVSRASADLAERFLGRKLEELAKGFGLSVSRFSEGYRRIAGRILPAGQDEFYLRNIAPADIPHFLRYIRFSSGNRTFSFHGEGDDGVFRIAVKDDVVRSIEHENSRGSAVIEVNKPMLDVTDGDFSGLELRGGYLLRVLR